MPREPEELDFKIHVDPSCLSEPMDEETNTPKLEGGEPCEPVREYGGNDKTEQAVSNVLRKKVKHNEHLDEEPTESATEEEQDDGVHHKGDAAGDSVVNQEIEASAPIDGTAEGLLLEEPSETMTDKNTAEEGADQHIEAEGESHADHLGDRSFESDHHDEDGAADQSFDIDDGDTPRPTQMPDNAEVERASPRESVGSIGSVVSERRTSLRTEALIQAAARAVVAKIEKRASSRVSGEHQVGKEGEGEEDGGDEGDRSILSTTTDPHEADAFETLSHDNPLSDSRRESSESQGLAHSVRAGSEGEAGGDSSSHHEAEDDVFSDRSPRSSLGSYDGGASDGAASAKAADEKLEHDDDCPSVVGSVVGHRRSARISAISEFSQFVEEDEEDDFVPAVRTTPRHPFRTTSAVKAMQMSSPAPSVVFSTPRSSKRHAGVLPSVSRLGSPNVSAQYSPKGRSTPPRFRVKKEEPPLVLLHATLLPLRWAWSGVLERLPDHRHLGKGPGGGGDDNFEPSEELKALRDSWRQLQDRMGDTMLERGILLPHPQNDYEVLEERLLEALELPLRRRARILECGHYLGPSNVDGFSEDDDGDSDDDGFSAASREAAWRRSTTSTTTGRAERRHWCGMCRSEIKYEGLGPGKVFRVKVYASNGLMRAGAWGACWKEMERVDVEVEPIVEPALQGELERLAGWLVEQEEREEREEREEQERIRKRAVFLGEDEEEGEEEEEEEEDEGTVQRELEEEHEPTEQESRPFAGQTQMHGFSSSPRGFSASSPPPPIQVLSPPLAIHRSSQSPSSPSTGHMHMLSPHSLSPPRQLHASPVRPREEQTPIGAEMDLDADRRRRDEERLREIYGDTPVAYHHHHLLHHHDDHGSGEDGLQRQHEEMYQQHHHHDEPPSSMRLEPNSAMHLDPGSSVSPSSAADAAAHRGLGAPDLDSSYVAPPTPVSPSEQAYDRRRDKKMGGGQGHVHHRNSPPPTPRPARYRDESSLPDLLLEAARVLMRDRRNVAIAALGFLVLLLAVRTAPGQGQGAPPAGGLGMMMSAAEREADILRTIYAHQRKEREEEGEEVVAPGVVEGSVEELDARPRVVEVMKSVAAPQGSSTALSEEGDAKGSARAAAAESSSAVSPGAPEQSAIIKARSGNATSAAAASPSTERKVVRVYETVTETVKVTATESVVVAAEAPSAAAAADDDDDDDAHEAAAPPPPVQVERVVETVTETATATATETVRITETMKAPPPGAAAQDSTVVPPMAGGMAVEQLEVLADDEAVPPPPVAREPKLTAKQVTALVEEVEEVEEKVELLQVESEGLHVDGAEIASIEGH